MILSEGERTANRLTEENLKVALQTLQDQGFVILKSALPNVCIDRMRDLFHEETIRQYGDMSDNDTPETVDVEAARVIFKEQVRDTQSITHRGIRVAMDSRFFDPLIIENPFAMQILKSAMGDEIVCKFPYQSNTAWPGCPIQHVHRDTHQLAPGDPYIPNSIVVNIPLVDFTEENGATEVWPGSHLTIDEKKPERGELEARVAGLPSVRVTIPAGSIVVRDMRCWHRGMANNTQIERVMIAMVYGRINRGGPPDKQLIPFTIWNTLSSQVQKLYRNHRPS